MKAIETRYKGYRFRSRLEARWAVLLDSAGVRWEYEKEGFTFGPLGAYLPDFWLPDLQVWLEAKGREPNDREVAVAHALADHTQRPVAIVGGEWDAWFDTLNDSFSSIGRYIIPACAAGRTSFNDRASLWLCEECGNVAVLSLHDDNWNCFRCGTFWAPLNADKLWQAIRAAKSARFEHGESGAASRWQR